MSKFHCLLLVWLAVLSETIVPPDRLDSLRDEVVRLTAENNRLAHENARLTERLGKPGPEEPVKVGSPAFIRCSVLAFLCVVLAALAAGLTMGLVSLEPMEMEIIVKSEEKDMLHEKDKKKLKADQAAATSILPLIQDHHRLLVTLLLMNSLANEALPLFLDKLVPSWMAVVLSVTLVLMFGEIIPSAVFTGSEQLRIAAKFAPMVSLFRCLLTPIAWPIAKVLDASLGEDHKGRYNFAELRAIVGIHAKLHTGPQHVAFKTHDDQGMGIITTDMPHNFTDQSIVSFSGESTKLRADGTPYFVKPCAPLKGRDTKFTFKLFTSEGRHPEDLVVLHTGDISSGWFCLQERDELKIMHGVMNLTHMQAKDAMVPLSKAYMLEGTQRMTRSLLQEILESGFSRIPVYSVHKHNIRGFILTKKLIVVTPEDETGKNSSSIESLGLDSLVVVPPTILMLDLLNKFQEDRCHLALVTNVPEEVTKSWDSNTAIPPDVHMAGIITMEDVIEKLLQEEIEDEHDARKLATVKSSMFPRNTHLARRHSEALIRRLPSLQQPLLPPSESQSPQSSL